MSNLLSRDRYDYLLLWGHGYDYRFEIAKKINENKNFKLISIIRHEPKSISNLIKNVYSFDYAPFHHLKSKTQYLKKTSKIVYIYIIKNINPKIDYFDVGNFRHKESITLKHFKEELRNRYNPRLEGKRTDEHVVHASDNELQTNNILKYLGYNLGIQDFIASENIFNVPYHIQEGNSMRVKMTDIDDVYCRISIKKSGGYGLVSMKVADCPHYLSLVMADLNLYQKYINDFFGITLRDYYSVEKFLNLAKKLKYLEAPYLNNYICIQEINGNLTIVDGLHRAAILKFRGENKIPMAILNEN